MKKLNFNQMSEFAGGDLSPYELCQLGALGLIIALPLFGIWGTSMVTTIGLYHYETLR